MRSTPGSLRGRSFDVLRLGESGPKAVFLHANGFSPLAYEPFLRELAATLQVAAMPLRPLWEDSPPARATPWSCLGDDLNAWLDAEGGEPVVLIGHSLGATAAMYAAARRPDLFRALVVIEPAMLLRWQAALMRWLPPLAWRIGPAGSTARKRDTWADLEAFKASARRSGLYDRLTDEAMEILANTNTRPGGAGVELVFPKDWEAHFYWSPPWPAPAFAKVSVPVVGIRGASSIFLDDERWGGCTATQPNGWFTQLHDYGHLLPLEGPVAAAAAVVDGLRAQGVLASS